MLWRRYEASQERGLRHVQVFGLLAEVVARCLFDPVPALPEINRVQVEREDLVLAELLLEPTRQDRLLDLALVAALGVEQHVLDDLLRDGAPALAAAPRTQVAEQGTQHAE